MGYYTSYTLIVEPKSSDLNDIIKAIASNENCAYALDTDDYFLSPSGSIVYDPMDAVKWYDYTKDMKALSLQFPESVFNLGGNGEDYGDIWEERWLNGRKQRRELEPHWGDWGDWT